MRVHGFDFLRGICALMVAVYHYLNWTQTAHLHAWGLFGVYIFFVLSGASMVVAYDERFAAGFPASRFLWYRFVRLAPLFGLAVALNLYSRPDPILALLNATLLFGVGNPGTSSLVIGGWSIGIEFAYYLMFPVLLSVARTRAALAVGVLLAVLQVAFVHHVLAGQTLSTAWAAYTQPLAFIAYFYAGCLIGLKLLRREAASHPVVFALLFGAVLAGSGPTGEATLTGLRGIALFALVIALVHFSGGLRIPQRIAKPLGDASYGIYLLHPFAFYVARKTGAPVAVLVPLALALSFAGALASFRFYEKPLQEWVRRRDRRLPQVVPEAPTALR